MIKLPDDIKTAVESHLEVGILSVTAVHGGDINQAGIIKTDSGVSYFIKWNTNAPDQMFETETYGLTLLNSADTDILIPKPLLYGKYFLLMELIQESKSGDSFHFGLQLAKLHKSTHDQFGLEYDNFIGRLPQSNLPNDKWGDFFIEQRILPQIKMAVDSGKMSTSKTKLSHCSQEFPDEPPALLHGDLWSGNYTFTKSGKASIYDPAVYYGHREMDLAMTRLFGGFSSDFYNGYNEEHPLQEGAEERFKLCNLYPILVHANLFGGHYVNQAESLLKRYFS